MGNKWSAYRILVRKPEGKRSLKNLDVDGRVILKWSLEKYYVVVDWIDLAQERGQWWALMKTVMNLRAPHNAENFLSGRATVSI
jgi:hypothetical protein